MPVLQGAPQGHHQISKPVRLFEHEKNSMSDRDLNREVHKMRNSEALADCNSNHNTGVTEKPKPVM